MDDLISRQAAIDAICEKGVREERKGHLSMSMVTVKQWTVDILEHMPSAQPEPQWIPCSERLPEVNVFVLVTLQHFNGEIDVIIAKVVKGYFSKGLEWESDDGEWTWDIECGFAWMPLPAPYQAERKDE